MRVTQITDVRNVARSFGFLLIVGITSAEDIVGTAPAEDSQSVHGRKVDKWHKWHWLPDPFKIGRYSPLKHGEVTFRNQTLVNFGPPDHMPEYYTYGFKVYEPKAGEFKDHREFRNGGMIHGSLKVVKENGSQTNIKYEGLPWFGWQALIETRNNSIGQVANGAASTNSTTVVPTKLLTIMLDLKESTTSKLTSTEASSVPTVTVDLVSLEETSPTPTTTEAASKATSIKSTSKLTSSGHTTKPATTVTAHKMARIDDEVTSESWPRVFRLGPSTESSLRKTPNPRDQIAQSWHYIQYPLVQKSFKLQSPLYHRKVQVRPTGGGAFTVHHSFPILSQHFLFSARRLSHRKLPESLIRSATATQRRHFSVCHEKTAWERVYHSLNRKKRDSGGRGVLLATT